MDTESYIDKIDEAFLKIERGKVYKVIIDEAERLLIEKALQRSYGNQIMAAKILGVNRNTLRSKINKLKIDVHRFKQ